MVKEKLPLPVFYENGTISLFAFENRGLPLGFKLKSRIFSFDASPVSAEEGEDYKRTLLTIGKDHYNAILPTFAEIMDIAAAIPLINDCIKKLKDVQEYPEIPEDVVFWAKNKNEKFAVYSAAEKRFYIKPLDTEFPTIFRIKQR